MRDTEDMLRSLPPESPPAEVVVAALRVFRYRAIAAIALACALVLSALILKSNLDRDARLLERIGQIRYTSGATQTLNRLQEVDGVKVLLWEVVTDETSSYVHVLGWDERGRDFTLAISGQAADDKATSLGEIEGYGGGSRPTHADLWQEIEAPSSADTLTFNIEVRGEDDGISGSVPFEIDI